MTNSHIARTATAALAMLVMPSIASAQSWTPGAEIVGQPIRVTTNGVTNTIYFDAGGRLRILTPGGNTVAGSWTVASGQLCANNGMAQECWPYNSPFQAGQPQTLTSSCSSTSSWLAEATNSAPPPPVERGERGK